MATGPARLTSFFVWMQEQWQTVQPSASEGRSQSVTAGVLQTQAEWPCLSRDQHLTSEAGSVVEEVTLWNLLRQYNPVMQSPSD